jgi:hypothetical protein
VPELIVFELKLKRLTGLNLTTLRRAAGLSDFDGNDIVYFLGSCGLESRGRSAPVSSFANAFDFAADRAGWSWSTVYAVDVVPVLVLDLWCDRGDVAPVLLWKLEQNIVTSEGVGVNFRAGTFPETNGVTVAAEMRCTPLFTPATTLQVARSAPDLSDVLNTISAQWMLIAEITKVEGLYQAVLDDESSYRGATATDGYTGTDDEGRIYLDHDLGGNWRPGYQAIRLTARVAARNGVVPDDAVVIWTAKPCNDRSDDREEMHRQAAACLDPATYEAPYGATPSIQGVIRRDPPWEQVGDFTLNVDPGKLVARTKAVVSLLGAVATSSVIFHCPDVGGDSFTIGTDVGTASGGVVTGGAQTGVLRMWRRVNVEYVRMASAFPLPVRQVADYFWAAFIQLDFTDERVADGGGDLAYFAETKEASADVRDQYIEAVFSRKATADWFCLIAARQQFNVVVSDTSRLLQSTGTIDRNGQTITFARPEGEAWSDPAPPAIGTIVVAWGDVGSPQLSFNVLASEYVDGATRVRCKLWPHDITPDFTGADADGSTAHAYTTTRRYYLRVHERAKDSWIVGGYGVVPDEVRFRASGKSSSYISGVSPTVTAAGQGRFAGRTMIFTHHGAYAETNVEGQLVPRANFEAEALVTIVHELTHAFGMPHKCGFWNWKTPREKTCSLNYSNHGMLLPNGLLDRSSAKKVGASLCGRHFKQLRFVKLANNPGLGWPT